MRGGVGQRPTLEGLGQPPDEGCRPGSGPGLGEEGARQARVPVGQSAPAVDHRQVGGERGGRVDAALDLVQGATVPEDELAVALVDGLEVPALPQQRGEVQDGTAPTGRPRRRPLSGEAGRGYRGRASMSFRRMIFPVEVVGRASTKRTERGRL